MPEGLIAVQGCRKCGRCNNICSTGALERIDGYSRINNELCELCMKCVIKCPNKALRLIE
ncbi:MAG: 4Fe-4S binding protein [Candidatus Methanoperedens sp.]|nr:4Fe-4S binding protein [Candidatus Methanoperedens sp.]PKL54217.1 MAG: ferredoxin [Candidatus Methanoperedenaceae archaeon HGW-Methanoperedenaceae-1]